MKTPNLEFISVDELWTLHLEISTALERKIEVEKTKLEKRLRQLQSNGASRDTFERKRRPYPQVFPKYRNPAKPAETWAGRGKQPRWLTAELKSGKKLEDFRIQRSSGRARRAGTRF
jgi:DNA-binding protein H-NS